MEDVRFRDMETRAARRATLWSALWWTLLLVAISSAAIHLKYTLHYGEIGGSWFRGHWGRNLMAWLFHLVFLFAPSAILLWLWWKTKTGWLLPAIAVALAVFAYSSWQPAGLTLLGALDLYPTHREAFHNYFERGDWRAYPQHGTLGLQPGDLTDPDVATAKNRIGEVKADNDGHWTRVVTGAEIP